MPGATLTTMRGTRRRFSSAWLPSTATLTVSQSRVGSAPDNKEAVAYYTEGRIVINHAHTVGIDAILEHEIWHVIDWRDNGRLDWAEDLPPSDPGAYAKR